MADMHAVREHLHDRPLAIALPSTEQRGRRGSLRQGAQPGILRANYALGARTVAEHRYGRGTFETHPNYIDYMQMIVDHPNFRGMPNAVNDDGRIQWQVSSGKTTSFYKDYVARYEWWVRKADELNLPGEEGSNGRFTLAARLIHPTGKRVCRLCGEERDIGYTYLNHRLAQRLNKRTGTDFFEKFQHIADILEVIDEYPEVEKELRALMPERETFFDEHGLTSRAFEASRHLGSNWLSPGFMGNPPDRLDGFHDYCSVSCRAKNDPGRSVQNLRSYNHDRRAFEYWAEGDWALADALFNSAASGQCIECGAEVDRVSPDHVGPLACGFKQMPVFVPTCQSCNSTKNRRMGLSDVQRLIEFEHLTGESAASWHVRGLWDALKYQVENDADAAELSAKMRALQDLYLRVLHALFEHGHARFLSTILSPEHAYFDYIFTGLDPSRLTYESVVKRHKRTPLRESLARRSVRIAFESLATYSAKGIAERKLRPEVVEAAEYLIATVVSRADEHPRTDEDELWDQAVAPKHSPEEVETRLTGLLSLESPFPEKDNALREFIEVELDAIGERAASLNSSPLRESPPQT